MVGDSARDARVADERGAGAIPLGPQRHVPVAPCVKSTTKTRAGGILGRGPWCSEMMHGDGTAASPERPVEAHLLLDLRRDRGGILRRHLGCGLQVEAAFA